MIINEGKAAASVGVGPISKKSKGFYNPEMKLNRDISIFIVKKLKPETILDANTLLRE